MKHLSSRFVSSFIALIILFSMFFSFASAPALAAVGLTSFEVASGNSDDELVITWATETEVDITAFLLRRSTTNDSNAATQAALLPALGAGVGGSSYEHRDENLTSGQTYYYWLYEITTGGETNLLTPDGISAVPGQPGSSATATPTATNSSAATATPTATARPATATPTATQVPTQAATAQNTNAPATDTSNPTNTPIPTNTLAPTNTPIPTNTPVVNAASTTAPTPTIQSIDTPEVVQQPAEVAAATDATQPEILATTTTDDSQVQTAERSETTALDQSPEAAPATESAGQTVAPTGITAVDTTPTAQAVAEAGADTSAAASGEAQAAAARPTATPRPSQSGESSNATGLLALIGGGSLCAAVLLAVIAIFIWRRH